MCEAFGDSTVFCIMHRDYSYRTGSEFVFFAVFKYLYTNKKNCLCEIMVCDHEGNVINRNGVLGLLYRNRKSMRKGSFVAVNHTQQMLVHYTRLSKAQARGVVCGQSNVVEDPLAPAPAAACLGAPCLLWSRRS